MTIPLERDQVQYDHKEDLDLILEYGTDDSEVLPIPKGMSGGGIWSIPTDLNPPVWAPNKSKIVGIIRAWRERSRHLIANRIEHWLDLVASDFPGLQGEIRRILDQEPEGA